MLLCKFSISSGKSHFASIDWIPAFAGMTDTYPTSSFPRKRESRSHYPDFLRSYVTLTKVPKVVVLLRRYSFRQREQMSVIPAFEGMTDTYSISSFPRKRESRKMAQQRIYPDLLRRYAVSKIERIP